MAKKSNNFSVKKVDDNNIVIEENKKVLSPLASFFVQNGKLIFAISFLFSITFLFKDNTKTITVNIISIFFIFIPFNIIVVN